MTHVTPYPSLSALTAYLLPGHIQGASVNFYKALKGLGPCYLAEHLPWKLEPRNQAFSVMAAFLWNSLPPEVPLAPSLLGFRTPLKTWLFSHASNQVILSIPSTSQPAINLFFPFCGSCGRVWNPLSPLTVIILTDLCLRCPSVCHPD